MNQIFIPKYICIKKYPNGPDIGTEVDDLGYTKFRGPIVLDVFVYPEYWEEIKAKKVKVGVIIGRFQIPFLHVGHIQLFNYVTKASDKTIVILGKSAVSYTDKNPLSVEIRDRIIRSHYNEVLITSVKDNISDILWSIDVDRKIDIAIKNYLGIDEFEVTIYGCRDSFIPHYSGKYKTFRFNTLTKESSTDIRRKIGKLNIYDYTDPAYHIIHAIENRFPIVYPTVDIALLQISPFQPSITWILLGKKPGEDFWRFPGGFVDPKDSDLINAASRELNEEVIGINTHELNYVSSHKVDDWRYRGTKDGIMTSLFATYLLSGEPKAGDDLEEVKWFDLNDFTRPPNFWDLYEAHKPLMHSLLNYINETERNIKD